MKENINLLISIDDNYVVHAIDLLYSISSYNDVFLNVYLIYGDDLSKSSLDTLERYLVSNDYGKLYSIYYEGDKSVLPKNIDYISITTYLRLFAPFLLPDNIDRILYLDCDIICNGDILDLYKMDFSDNVIVGCRNMLPERLRSWSIRNNRRLSLDDDYKYINAGVLLINLDLFRKRTSVDDIVKVINDYSERLLFQDQDVINKIFFDIIKVIDNKYNFQVNPYEGVIDYNDIRLVHFSEKEKPWNEDYKYPRKGYIYYKFLIKRGKDREVRELIEKQFSNLEKDFIDCIFDD